MTDWGTIYNRALARGEDHGAAAYLADQWEQRDKRKRRKALKGLAEMDQKCDAAPKEGGE